MLPEFHNAINAANAFYERHKGFYESWLRNPEAAKSDEEFMELMTAVVELRKAQTTYTIRNPNV